MISLHHPSCTSLLLPGLWSPPDSGSETPYSPPEDESIKNLGSLSAGSLSQDSSPEMISGQQQDNKQHHQQHQHHASYVPPPYGHHHFKHMSHHIPNEQHQHQIHQLHHQVSLQENFCNFSNKISFNFIATAISSSSFDECNAPFNGGSTWTTLTKRCPPHTLEPGSYKWTRLTSWTNDSWSTVSRSIWTLACPASSSSLSWHDWRRLPKYASMSKWPSTTRHASILWCFTIFRTVSSE